MGYPNFGKVKTIVLPVPANQMTYAQYKEKYGIDLKDFIELGSTSIRLKSNRNVFLIADFTEIKELLESYFPNLCPIGSLPMYAQDYDDGVQDGCMRIYLCDFDESLNEVVAHFMLQFLIPQDREFKFENMYIQGSEY